MTATTENPAPLEQDDYWRWRYHQARAHGLTRVEARVFADGREPVDTLRKLKQNGCPPATIARIVT